MAHGFYTCEYCRKIVFMLALKDAFVVAEGVRFNQLLKFARRVMNSKIAAPTLIRHLKYLVGAGIVKRTQKSKQNIVYSLTSENPLISREDIELAAKWYRNYMEGFGSLTLRKIVQSILRLSQLLELEMIKIYLQKTFTNVKPESLVFKAEFIKLYYREYGTMLMEAARDKKAEYRGVMNLLEKEIGDMRNELFTS